MKYTTKTINHSVYGVIEVKVFDIKKERKPRVTKLAKQTWDKTKVLYDSKDEPENKRMYAGISTIYVSRIINNGTKSVIELSNKIKLENCTTKQIKMGEATQKYLGYKKCFDFIDLKTGQSKLKEILPNVSTQDSSDVHSQEVSGYNQTKRLTSLDIRQVFKDVSFNRA